MWLEDVDGDWWMCNADSRGAIYAYEFVDYDLLDGEGFKAARLPYGDGRFGYDDDESLIPSLVPLNAYGDSKQQFDVWALEQERLVGDAEFRLLGRDRCQHRAEHEHRGDVRELRRLERQRTQIDPRLDARGGPPAGAVKGTFSREFLSAR